jgi:hypothetical protein
LKKLYRANAQKSYEVCIELAVGIFQDVFNHQIKQLLSAFQAAKLALEQAQQHLRGLHRYGGGDGDPEAAAAAEAAREMAESREKIHNRQRLEAEREAAKASKEKIKVEAQAQYFGRFW